MERYLVGSHLESCRGRCNASRMRRGEKKALAISWPLMGVCMVRREDGRLSSVRDVCA